MDNKHTILMMKLSWVGNIFSKAIYTFIAYNGYKSKGAVLSNSWVMPTPVFLIMGIFSALIGVIVCRSLLGKIPALKTLANKMVVAANSGSTAGGVFNIYLIGIGAIETAAIFGLVGFITSLNITFFAIMMSASIIGWLAANPFIKKQQY